MLSSSASAQEVRVRRSCVGCCYCVSSPASELLAVPHTGAAWASYRYDLVVGATRHFVNPATK